VTFAILLLACDPPPVEVDAPQSAPIVAQKTTLATVAGLGSHQLEARTTTRTTRDDGDPVEEEEAFTLRWTDEDHWQVVRKRGTRILEDVRVWDGQAYRSVAPGRWDQRGDAEPYRASLSVSWDPWVRAFGESANAIGFVAAGKEDIEGRTALVYTLQPLTSPDGAPRSRALATAEGKVWIDEATAARLVGDAHLVVQDRGLTRDIRLRFSLSGIGRDSGAEPPPTAAPAVGAPNAGENP
jgi:hypothetical protein